jgi:uncharacterized protein YdaU (DUF1376 family)
MPDAYAPPAFQLYAREWLTDTTLLSAEEKGALIDLRAHAWLAASRGELPCSLPNDDVKLARLSGLNARWRKVATELRPFFRVDGDRLVDDALLGYRREIEQNHNDRAKGARKTNAKRWGDSVSESLSDRGSDSVSESLSDRGSDSVSESLSDSPSGRSASASASASASKSGAERMLLNGGPPPATATATANGSAPPAPPADAAAAEERTAPPLPDDALLLLYRMPDAKREDGERQLRATLTAQGARLKAGEYVRAYSPKHLAWACHAVLESPPDKPEQLARWMLLKLRDTYAEWRSRDEKHGEQRIAPAIAALVTPPIDETDAAYGWLAQHPDAKRDIEADAERKFNGFPKTAGMLADHSRWIDREVVARWKAAGSPVHAVAVVHDPAASRSGP